MFMVCTVTRNCMETHGPYSHQLKSKEVTIAVMLVTADLVKREGYGRLPGLNVGDLSQDAQQWGEEPEETTSSS